MDDKNFFSQSNQLLQKLLAIVKHFNYDIRKFLASINMQERSFKKFTEIFNTDINQQGVIKELKSDEG